MSLPIALVGDDDLVETTHGRRRYVCLDAAASTGALPEVARRVEAFLPSYSSVHRGAGYKSQVATSGYEAARAAALRFGGGSEDDVAVVCRNTTEAVNQLAYRLRLDPNDVVVSTVVEHHANLLPWTRMATVRFVECDADGVFGVDDVVTALETHPRPKLLAVTGASNVTGWVPPIEEIIEVAHERGVPVAVDAAQLAPHRPLPRSADFLAWSAHKMYAPFGAGVLIGPRSAFTTGDPFLHGGGAVDLVDLDEVLWTEPPEREEAGSPNVIGAVALHAAIDTLEAVGWPALMAHEKTLAARLKAGLGAIDGVRLLGPGTGEDTLAVAAFVIEGQHHALVAARLSAEFGIGVRHGCFCAHPYLMRLLGVSSQDVRRLKDDVIAGDRRLVPGAVRASCGIFTSANDIDDLCSAVAVIASDPRPELDYVQDVRSGDFTPRGMLENGLPSAACRA